MLALIAKGRMATSTPRSLIILHKWCTTHRCFLLYRS